ncbi:unnamed protein product, partial [Musa textilis]
ISYSFHLQDEARLFTVAEHGCRVHRVTESALCVLRLLTGFHSSRMAVKE